MWNSPKVRSLRIIIILNHTETSLYETKPFVSRPRQGDTNAFVRRDLDTRLAAILSTEHKILKLDF